MNAKIMAVDFYNQTVCADGSTQTIASVASTDKNKTGGVLVVMGCRLTSTTDARSYTKEQER